MNIGDQWSERVCELLFKVEELMPVWRDLEKMDSIKQEWFYALLVRLKEDAVHLKEAVVSTADTLHLESLPHPLKPLVRFDVPMSNQEQSYQPKFVREQPTPE